MGMVNSEFGMGGGSDSFSPRGWRFSRIFHGVSLSGIQVPGASTGASTGVSEPVCYHIFKFNHKWSGCVNLSSPRGW